MTYRPQGLARHGRFTASAADRSEPTHPLALRGFRLTAPAPPAQSGRSHMTDQQSEDCVPPATSGCPNPGTTYASQQRRLSSADHLRRQWPVLQRPPRSRSRPLLALTAALRHVRTCPYRTCPYRTCPYRTCPYRTCPYRTCPRRTAKSRQCQANTSASPAEGRSSGQLRCRGGTGARQFVSDLCRRLARCVAAVGCAPAAITPLARPPPGGECRRAAWSLFGWLTRT